MEGLSKPERQAGGGPSGLTDTGLRMLMAHFVAKVPDQSVHFVLYVQFFLLFFCYNEPN